MIAGRDALSIWVNEHKLIGTKQDGKWSFACEDFPSLSKQHDGDTEPHDCTLNFMRLCLEPSLKNRAEWEKHQ